MIIFILFLSIKINHLMNDFIFVLLVLAGFTFAYFLTTSDQKKLNDEITSFLENKGIKLERIDSLSLSEKLNKGSMPGFFRMIIDQWYAIFLMQGKKEFFKKVEIVDIDQIHKLQYIRILLQNNSIAEIEVIDSYEL